MASNTRRADIVCEINNSVLSYHALRLSTARLDVCRLGDVDFAWHRCLDSAILGKEKRGFGFARISG